MTQFLHQKGVKKFCPKPILRRNKKSVKAILAVQV